MTINLILLSISIIVLLIILFFYISSVINFIRLNVPQIATYNSDFEIMKKGLIKYNLKGKKIIDLGSGTGKSLRFFEKYFKASSTGYEIDYSNYLVSIVLNKINGLNSNIKRDNFLNANLKEFDFIYMYLFQETMDKYADFIYSNSNKGTIIFANAFKFSNKIPIEILYGVNGKEEMYIYQV